MKFIADRMLGRLAKWLRALGLDVYYDKELDRSSLIRIAREEGRLILTRAHNFSEIKHIPPHILIKDEILEDQLKQMIEELGSQDFHLFSRCMECNLPLKEVSKEFVAEKVPKKSFQMHNEYKICPGCGRVYWSGTHVDRMRKLLKRFVKK